MNIEQSIFSTNEGWNRLETKLGSNAELVLVFGSNELLKSPGRLDEIRSLYPNAELVGCSTSGEITDKTVYDNTISITAIQFEKSTFKIESTSVGRMEESFDTGRNLAGKFDNEGLKHILVFSVGLNINGSELTRGLNMGMKKHIPVTGGLAGDQDRFQQTNVIHNEVIKADMVVAIGFYGANLHFGYGCSGGWTSFGVDRKVTRSKANILYELDGEPALDLYKKYLGTYASKLPSSALLFPLELRFPDKKSLTRTVLSVNESEGSMTFAGDIPEGSYVRLMNSNVNKLTNGAYSAAQAALRSLNEKPDLGILISCVGRKLVLKNRTDEEIEIVKNELPDTPITGFYSYGEICPFDERNDSCELHNQTMTITFIKESK